VRACVDRGCDLADLSLDDLRQFSQLVADDVFQVLTLEGSVAARDHVGGTAPKQVKAAIARVRAELG
jgi:argininosuccinate lyase